MRSIGHKIDTRSIGHKIDTRSIGHKIDMRSIGHKIDTSYLLFKVVKQKKNSCRIVISGPLS